MNIKLDSRLSK